MARLRFIGPTFLALTLATCLGIAESQQQQQQQQQHYDANGQHESKDLRSIKVSHEEPMGKDLAGFTGKSIGVYSIFMGSYDIFFPDFLENIRTYFLPEHSKRFFIVTDQKEICKELLASEADVECAVKEDAGWPYESLYRWNYFKTSFTPSAAISHIFFLNANTRCVDTIDDDILAPHVAVLHNMFIDSGYDEMSFEKNPISTAYIPPEGHFKYFGARFLGASTENFVKMCDVLDRNTQIDESNHFIAAWHDESHYNHYINVILDQQDVKMLGAEYHIPEELYGTDKVGAAKGVAKVIYLDKKQLPEFEPAKDRIWQKTIGGNVNFHYSLLESSGFRASVYRSLNPQLKAMSDEELQTHYISHPETPYFYETPVFAALFDASKYMTMYGLESELMAKYHYIRVGAWSEDHSFPVRGSNVDDEVFLSYWWQKGDRLERDLTHRRKLGLSIYSGTPNPTSSPTQAPTAAPNPNFNAVAQNYVCGPEIYLNNNGARRRTLAATVEQPVTIKLANDTADECYSACYNKLAPNNNAFVFNLYPVNGSTVCTCCRECAEWRAVPGAVIYSTCNDVDLNVISKHANVHHFLGYKFKAVVGNNEDVNLVNMGVSIQLDSSIGMVKSLASPPRKYLKKPIITNATSLTWPVVPLKANKKQAFKIKVKAKRGTPDKKLVFTVSTFQTFVSPSGDKENVCYNTKTLAANYFKKVKM